MKNYVSKFAMFVALCTGVALAQAMPAQQSSPQSMPPNPSASQPAQPDQSAPSTPSASQPAPDQSQPAQPDQSTSEGKGQTSSPDAMPKSDQDKDKDKDKDQSKMPQSDAAAASTGGDVQSQVQTAIQQDPKLANANITVAVKGNKLELTGTVPSNDEKKQAEQIAKSNAGNLKVKNHIKVASGNMPGQDKDKDKDKMSAPPKQQ
jgi:BON domain-containing protein